MFAAPGTIPALPLRLTVVPWLRIFAWEISITPALICARIALSTGTRATTERTA